MGQSFYFEIHVQMIISLSIFDGFQQMRAQNLSYVVYNLKMVICGDLQYQFQVTFDYLYIPFLGHPVVVARLPAILP